MVTLAEESGIIGTALKQWASWIVEWLDQLAKPLVMQAIDKIPDISPVTSGLGDLLAVINYWVPLSECIHMFELYISFVIVFITVKLIIKNLLPGLG